ncbi:GNAT family N-acetyltransferase [Sinisalibacter aestuarii]|uniref:N-acetyltransferase domain-containing protein n=1 Tax=Sinisalibacter aestuarii TaxID=2949426 RepID=A0ABQ5LNA5_9RHOB|nr:hypothetical protein [Sinisalibacter aestuarii]GKY86492.1 hypothetical protein STA1M1_03610 [Sinisalibacter aestuarii]
MIDYISDSANFILRPATLADTRQMAGLAGGATGAQALADWMDDGSAYAAWHVAEDPTGRLLGFQRIGAKADLTSGACEIATFLRDGAALAVGSRLFEATAEAARLLGYRWIDARFARGNEGAGIYYQSHGFRLLGETADSITMRYEID